MPSRKRRPKHTARNKGRTRRRSPPSPWLRQRRTTGIWRWPWSTQAARSRTTRKMDNTQTGSATVAIEKARTAAMFKRPTKVFEHAVAGGGAGLRAPRVPGVIPVEGGIPLIIDDKIVGQ